MSNVQPPRSDSHSEPLFTIRISKRAGWLIALMLLCVFGYVVTRNRDRQVAAQIPPPSTVLAPASLVSTTIDPPKIPETKSAEPATLPVINHTENVQVMPATTLVETPVAPTVISDQRTFVEEQPVVAVSEVVREVKLAARGAPTSVIQGAGATFPYRLYTMWFSEYHKTHPEAEFQYQSLGSGAGIRQVMANTVDFGASDVPMTDEQLHSSQVSVLHIPTVMDAIVPIYHVPGVGELRFTPEILAEIYLGKITSWSDPAIAAQNSSVALPKIPIVVVHRSDGSSTSLVFSDYLSKVSPEWSDSIGKGTSVRWPTGLGAKGNEGVAAMVRQMDGTIGYVEFIYASENDLPFGSIRNGAGRFVKASLETMNQAGASVKDIPEDLRVSITNAPGIYAYPICSYTWLLVPKGFENSVKARDLVEFLRWINLEGRGMAAQLGYAPLPGNMMVKVNREIAKIR